MRTKALVIDRPGADFTYRDIDVDENIRATEVLVQIVASGVCRTDLDFSQNDIEGMFPAVLGHEGAGIISQVGSKVSDLQVGDRVVLGYTSCGEWRGGDGSKAYAFPADEGAGEKAEAAEGADEMEITSHFFGQSSFSKFAVADARCCIKVGEPGDDVDLPSLAPLGCGILSGAGAMLNVINPSAEDIVCVVGAGSVGLAAVMALNFLKDKPKQIIVVDVIEERLKLAKKYGATHVVNPSTERDLPGALKRITNFEGLDASIDATGRIEILRDLLEATAKLGTVCSVGVGKLDSEVSINVFNAVNSGRKYVGCCMGNVYPPEFVPKLIQGWKDGIFPFTDLIKRYSAEEMELAKSEMLDGTTVKAVLVWD